MISYLEGDVLFSDGKESILKSNDGIGYQVYFNGLLVEGQKSSLFIAHVFRDAGQELFGFETLRDKKLFELLTSVKGVGPKSAFSLLTALGAQVVIQSVQLEDKKALSKAPGIGAKAAAQICLDLSKKIQTVLMYAGGSRETHIIGNSLALPLEGSVKSIGSNHILDDAVMACKELGFKEDQIMVKAQKILMENDIQKAEQLVHLVLKEV